MPTTPKTVNLALQGGGAHGAFTWGVLDRLLDDERISFEGICATSAGAMNAAVMAYGLTIGGREGAKRLLADYWRRVSEAARQGVAAREELTGSTITLTSLGALGGVASTPVVNRPEVAIVGVNKMVVKPVWRDGGFVPRKTMNLSSSFDHRVVDGYDAATFIQRVRALVETPAVLFIED